MPPRFSKEIRDLFSGPPPGGTPFGDVAPLREVGLPPLVDGRTVALRTLKKYLGEVTFYRHGGYSLNAAGAKIENPPIDFRIPARDIHVEWPDSVEDLAMPSLAFLSTREAEYEAIGMTSYVEEDTVDKYEPGTVLIWLYEFVETFSIEVWCETKAQRRAIVAGIERALCPLEYMSGVRFKMPDYYDQLVCFALQGRELVDDDFAVRNRRRARMSVEMRHNVVALVPVNPLELTASLEVGEEVAEGDEGPATATEEG